MSKYAGAGASRRGDLLLLQRIDPTRWSDSCSADYGSAGNWPELASHRCLDFATELTGIAGGLIPQGAKWVVRVVLSH